jgi:hypothetical protein
MNATFTSTGPETFTGSVTLVTVATCQVNGTYGKPVKLHLTCPDGKATLLTHLNRTTQTLGGAGTSASGFPLRGVPVMGRRTQGQELHFQRQGDLLCQ